mmetsp:Transcript_75062/g.140034  ORF Transcript_75062/g.140034 Transcript_75062/m.140034 type:complete len:130 (-) Transcript_75062:73-462(-)
MQEGLPRASIRPLHGGYPSPRQWSMSFSYLTGFPRCGGDWQDAQGCRAEAERSLVAAKRPPSSTHCLIEEVIGSLAPLKKRLRSSGACPTWEAVVQATVGRKRTSLDAFGFGGQQAAIGRGPMFRRQCA